MKDTIYRDDAIEAWDKLSKRGRTEFDQVLMTLPSTDVVSREEYEKVLIECGEVKTKLGELQQTTKVAQREWIKTVDGNGWNEWYVLKCPFCGATIEDKHYHSWEYNFCPHCGERVKGGDSE